MDPYYKPEGPRLSQLHSDCSMEEEEDSCYEEGLEEGVDFGATLETFASTYELELQDLIQDLNLELERVSSNMEDEEEGGEERGDLVRDVFKQGGGKGVMAKVANGEKPEGVELDVICNEGGCSHGKVNGSTGSGLEESVGGFCGSKRFICHQTSSDSDGDSVVFANATMAENSSLPNGISTHSNSCQGSKGDTSEGEKLSPHRHSGCAQGNFNNYEVRLKKAIRDLSSLSTFMVSR